MSYDPVMRRRDTADVIASSAAVLADALAVGGGFLLATWIRFDSGLIPLSIRWPWLRKTFGAAVVDVPPPDLYTVYGVAAAFAAVLFLFIFRNLGLYVRPQIGRFSSKIPRLIRATGIGILSATALAFAVGRNPPLARLVIAISFVTVLVLVFLERYLLFRAELHYARHNRAGNRVLVVGVDEVAARLKSALEREPRLGSRVIGFLRPEPGAVHAPDIRPEEILGGFDDLRAFVEGRRADQVILAASTLPHARVVEILLLCERNLITFNAVPDLFRVLTARVDMQMIDDVPLLGVEHWPLDHFWNRLWKRAEDVVGAAIGLVLTAPVLAVAALAIRKTSPGPVFYRQERCGENGRSFTVYKLRSMRVDAEQASGPVWASEDDPRRTKVGAFLRRHNIDELPQLWNVLRGDMSLVGPRPERPHFVEQFREDIGGYMWRHVSKPGITGWAQVNGLRGNTSIEERIKYDLFYLENWSLALDFKILLRTLFARENAY